MAHTRSAVGGAHYEGAQRGAAQRPKPKPPSHEPKATSYKSKAKPKAREVQISEEQRL